MWPLYRAPLLRQETIPSWDVDYTLSCMASLTWASTSKTLVLNCLSDFTFKTAFYVWYFRENFSMHKCNQRKRWEGLSGVTKLAKHEQVKSSHLMWEGFQTQAREVRYCQKWNRKMHILPHQSIRNWRDWGFQGYIAHHLNQLERRGIATLISQK